jgi:hypothetical protein
MPVKNPMSKKLLLGSRLLVIFAAAGLRLTAATTATLFEAPTATQAVLLVNTDQAGNCTYRASEGNAFGALVNDINFALFAGANSDARPGSIVRGKQRKFVLGSRTTQVSPFDKRRYSRALQANTSHIAGVTCGSDAEVTLRFTTANPDSGISYQEPRFDRAFPGQYNYPSIPWSTRGKGLVDPSTGVLVKLVTLPGDMTPATSPETFRASLAPGAGWGCAGQACNYSGTSQGSLFLPITPVPNGTFPTGVGLDGGADWMTLTVQLSGSAGSVNVCLSNDRVSCASAVIAQNITATATQYTIGSTTPVLEAWRNGPLPPASTDTIRTHGGSVNKLGATVTWAGGDYFLSAVWGSGSVIQLGGTDCTVLSMTSDRALTLANPSCVADGSGLAYAATNFGFLIQPGTTSSATVAVSSPRWTLGTSGGTFMSSAGFFDQCSPVSVNGPTGPGNLCGFANGYGPPNAYNTGVPLFWIGQDGTVNLIGLSDTSTPPGLNNGLCRNSNGLSFDGSVGGRYYCTGTNNGGVSYSAIFAVQYSGNYAATTPAFDSPLPNSAPTLLTSDLNALLVNFDTTGNFAQYLASGPRSWGVVSWQTFGAKGALFLQSNLFNQDSPGWQAIFDLNTNSVIAMQCSYCGALGQPNRWGGHHSGFGLRQYTWTIMTENTPVGTGGANFVMSSVGTFGGPPWSACPPNPFGVTGPNCTTIAVGSTIPLAGGVSLLGQAILPGDYVSGNQECMRALTISGTSIVWQRNTFTEEGFGICGVRTSHAANIDLVMIPSVIKELWWDWQHDPHATDGSGAYLVGEKDGDDCHYGYSVNTMVLGCLNGNRPQLPGKPIRLGPMPANLTNPVFYVNWDAPFSTANSGGSDNFNESHPSQGQTAASAYDQQHFIDNRPFLGFGTPSVGVTKVGTYLYRVPAASLPQFNYRIRNWIVQSGTKLAVDSSGPGAVLHDTLADWYKYCNVLLAGECVSGSQPGETYVNFPFVSSLTSVPSRFITPVNDIAIDEWQHAAQSVVEVDVSRGADSNGAGVRVLTSAFAPGRSQSIFWNSREVPAGGWIFTNVQNLDGVRNDGVLIKKPPFPIRTSANNADYIRVPLSLSGVPGDQVRVRFGFGEYDQGQLASGNLPPCHTRNEPCAADGTGVQPYLWESETQHPTACDSGCTVLLKVPPAPSGRVVYYQVVRTNGARSSSDPMDILVVR